MTQKSKLSQFLHDHKIGVMSDTVHAAGIGRTVITVGGNLSSVVFHAAGGRTRADKIAFLYDVGYGPQLGSVPLLGPKLLEILREPKVKKPLPF